MKYRISFLLAFSVVVLSFSSCKKENKLEGTTWTIYYDWYYGTDGSGKITFKSNHTIDWYGNSSWSQIGKSMSFYFYWTDAFGKSLRTDYEGSIEGDKMSGTCSNTAGDSGTWNAVRD